MSILVGVSLLLFFICADADLFLPALALSLSSALFTRPLVLLFITLLPLSHSCLALSFLSFLFFFSLCSLGFF